MKSNNKLIVIATIFLLMVYGCGKTVYPSVWQSAQINPDGDLTEWSLPLQYYDAVSKLNYSISNDDHNLYICTRAVDIQTQMKMIRGGFEVWIDISGGKNKNTGIRFPLPESLLPNHIKQTYKQGEKPNMNSRMQQLISEQNQMQILGFRDRDNGLSMLQNPNGIIAAVKWDSTGVLGYEAVIPFKTFYKEQLTNTDNISTWSVCLVLNGIEMNIDREKKSGGNDSQQNGGTSSRMGGVGGMHGGGRGGGGGRMSSGGQRNEMSETNTIWNYIKLSLK